ncbi:MAG: M48 family metalloprotease, partial [Actinobacteria bacterium]|nr:M48 family metalloprotease [Actinomycetota bacterium]
MQGIKIFGTHPIIAWLIFSTLVLAVLMALLLLVVNFIQRPPSGSTVREFFSIDFISRAYEYNRAALTLSIARHFITWVYILIIILLSWRYLASAGTPVHVAAGYIALFFLVLYLILLPLSFYRGFTLEHNFGLSTQSAGSWFMDHLKSTGIDLFVNTAALTGFYALMVYLPRYWWIVSAAIMIVFIVAATYLYPVLIDPLFYDFEKPGDRELEKDIITLAQRAGINTREVLVADASRRTLKANAYFTGVGNTKRIVLYDNLVN